MADIKTKKTSASVPAFLAAIKDEARRKDCQAVAKIMRKATGVAPRMWGPAIVGFGDYKYKAGSGSEGNWFLVGFSPRKQNLTLYIMTGFGIRRDLMVKLGKYSTGVSCLYIKRLADVDLKVLTELIGESVERITRPKTPA